MQFTESKNFTYSFEFSFSSEFSESFQFSPSLIVEIRGFNSIKKTKKMMFAMIGLIILAALLITAIIIIIVVLKKRRKEDPESATGDQSQEVPGVSSTGNYSNVMENPLFQENHDELESNDPFLDTLEEDDEI